MEAAAAGRLVISTPVGGFPYLAARGGGITAPLGAEEYKAFVTEKLMHYKERPDEYMETCSKIQEAALQFDWEYTVEEWIKLIESAMPPSKSTAQTGVA
jgi:glycosyltransferase involved in cell wall biosynthesis